MMNRMLLLAAVMVFSGCARKLPPYEKPMARTQFQRVRTTAYTHSESDHLVHGCKTCIGTNLRYGAIRSAAADWSRWPLGTKFRILETGEICEVDDIGWALSGRNTIDLYKPSRSAMNAWGARMVNIEILEWGTDRDALAILSKRTKHAHVKRMVKDLEKRVDSRTEDPPVIRIAASAPITPEAASQTEPLRVSSSGGLRARRDLDSR